MKNIENININTNFCWNIKMLNKNSFLKRISFYADESFIRLKIDNLLKKINKFTTLEDETLFDVRNDAIINTNLVDHKNFKKINSENDTYVFNYRIQLNKNYRLNKFIEHIDLTIYFDQENYLINGGFSWRFNNLWKTYERINKNLDILPDKQFVNISSIYLNNLIQIFFSELLVNLSFGDLVKLIKYEGLSNLHNLHIYTNNVYSINELYEQWNKYMYEKFFYQFYESLSKFKVFGKELFDFFVLIFINYFAIINELKNQFYENINTPFPSKIENSNSIHEVIRNLSEIFVTNIISKKRRSKKYISVVTNLDKDNIFLSNANVIYDISLDAEDEVFSKNFYFKKKDIYLYLILLLYPEYFGISEESMILKNYQDFLANLFDFYHSEFILDEHFNRKIKKNYLYDDYNYSSYLRKRNLLIFHHDNLNNLELELIFTDTLLLNSLINSRALSFSILNLQWHLAVEDISSKNKFLYKQIKQEVEDLTHIPKIEEKKSNIKSSMKEYSNKIHLTNNINFLKQEVNLKDEFDKRQRFIEIIIIGFIVASLISLIDYMNMVWTDLNCSYPGSNAMIAIPYSEFSIIFSTVIIVINTIILVGSLIYLMYAKKKNSDIATRKEVKL